MESTKDYEVFKPLSGNRKINYVHVNELVDAIKERNLLSVRPILVNEKFEIIDGQHRLEAAKILNEPIFYIQTEGLNIKDVALVNTHQKNWNMETFLDVYTTHLKNENYIKLRNFYESFEFTLSQALAFFMDESQLLEFRNKFKSGEFVFSEEISKIGESFRILLKKIESLNRGPTRVWKSQGMVRAFLIFFKNPEIDQRRFWDQLEKYNFIISPKRSKQEFLEMFYELYNYRRSNRIDL